MVSLLKINFSVMLKKHLLLLTIIQSKTFVNSLFSGFTLKKMKKTIKLAYMKWIVRLLPLVLIIPIYVVLYKIYIPKVNAFGCFDDCFNYLAGYFIQNGKELYSEIFFNHQPLMAYASYFVQLFSDPINIYDLVLRHRQVLLVFSLFMNIMIILRFGLAGAGFALFYEFTKYYWFGDRFLAEGFIVYPAVYMLGVIWRKLHKMNLYTFDFILCGIFSWFIIFMREPFFPLSLLMFVLILWGRPFSKSKAISLVIFSVLTILFLIILPIQEYIFNVVTVSNQTVFRSELQNGFFGISNIIRVFFYPISLFFGGDWNFIRPFMVILSGIFLLLVFHLVLIQKKFKLVGFVILFLGFANLRPVIPVGKIYYEAFHMIPWYGMFIFLIFLMFNTVNSYSKIIFRGLLAVFIGLFLYIIISPDSIINERLDPHEVFLTNFGKELQVGEVVKILSEPSDTLFIDGFDDLIYWQAKRMSSYKYTWYTSVMPFFSKYTDARLEMFKNDPPDFYYGSCPGEMSEYKLLPKDIKQDYQQLHSRDDPTCLYIKKAKMQSISSESWKKAKDFGYELPSVAEIDQR